MYKLTKSLPYLLYTISNNLTETFSVELRDYDLTISMYRVLAALLEREDQRLIELSEMIYIEASTLSRLVGVMKSRGLVSRRRQQADERAVRLNLTAKGRTLVETLVPRALYYEQLTMRAIDAEDGRIVKTLLSNILENVADLGSIVVRDDKHDATVRKASPKAAQTPDGVE